MRYDWAGKPCAHTTTREVRTGLKTGVGPNRPHGAPLALCSRCGLPVKATVFFLGYSAMPMVRPLAWLVLALHLAPLSSFSLTPLSVLARARAPWVPAPPGACLRWRRGVLVSLRMGVQGAKPGPGSDGEWLQPRTPSPLSAQQQPEDGRWDGIGVGPREQQMPPGTAAGRGDPMSLRGAERRERERGARDGQEDLEREGRGEISRGGKKPHSSLRVASSSQASEGTVAARGRDAQLLPLQRTELAAHAVEELERTARRALTEGGKGMPSVVQANKVLKMCADDCGNGELAARVMGLLRQTGVAPDRITYNTLLDVCAKSAARRGVDAFVEGLELMDTMVGDGIAPDLVSYNSLLNTAAKGAAAPGNAEWSANGLKVLAMMQDKGLSPDVNSYNVLIDACAQAASARGSRGRVEEGMLVLTRMRDAGIEPDIISYNSLLNTCAKAAGVWGSVSVSQASRIIEMMQGDGVAPDLTSFNCLLNAYAQAAAAGQGYSLSEIMQVIQYIKAQGVSPDLYSYNTIMNLCAKSAKASARGGRAAEDSQWGLDEGLFVLQCMSEDGLEADVVTYTALLDTCIASLRGAGNTQTVEHCSMILSMMRTAGDIYLSIHPSIHRSIDLSILSMMRTAGDARVTSLPCQLLTGHPRALPASRRSPLPSC